MSKKQKSLQDVVNALEAATDAIEEITRRAMYDNPPTLSFEQRVIAAARGIDNGEPTGDHLDCGEMEQAIKVLADIYTVTGVAMPDDWV